MNCVSCHSALPWWVNWLGVLSRRNSRTLFLFFIPVQDNSMWSLVGFLQKKKKTSLPNGDHKSELPQSCNPRMLPFLSMTEAGCSFPKDINPIILPANPIFLCILQELAKVLPFRIDFHDSTPYPYHYLYIKCITIHNHIIVYLVCCLTNPLGCLLHEGNHTHFFTVIWVSRKPGT